MRWYEFSKRTLACVMSVGALAFGAAGSAMAVETDTTDTSAIVAEEGDVTFEGESTHVTLASDVIEATLDVGEVKDELDVVAMSDLDVVAFNREGYELVGWSTASDGEVAAEPATEPAEDAEAAPEDVFVPLDARLYNLSYLYVDLTQQEYEALATGVEAGYTSAELGVSYDMIDVRERPDGSHFILVSDSYVFGDAFDETHMVKMASLSEHVVDGQLTLYPVWKEIASAPLVDMVNELSNEQLSPAPTMDAVADVAEEGTTLAVTVEGDAAESVDAAQTTLMQMNVPESDAKLFARNLFEAPPLKVAPPEETVPRQADGSEIVSISAKWMTEDTIDNGDASLLYLKPGADNEQAMVMRINYALAGEHDYDAGDITITIPAELVYNRDGNADGHFTIPYPQEPKRNKDFNWTRIGDTYVLTNTKRMSAATKGFIEFELSELVPHKQVDMQTSDPFWARIEVTTWAGNTIGLTSNSLTAQIDTEEIVDAATKRLSNNPHWVTANAIPESQRVAGEEEYVVVRYYMYGHITGNTEFTLDMTDTIPDEYNGFIIGATSADGRTYFVDDILSGWRKPSETPYSYVEVAYPGSQFEPNTTYTFHNTVEYTLTEADPECNGDEQKVTMQSASASVPWSWHKPVFVHPTGHFMLNKIGNDGVNGMDNAPYWSRSYYNYRKGLDYSAFHNTDDGYGIYPSALNDIADGNDVELAYTVESIGYMMPWTFEGTPDQRAALDHYNINPVTMVTYDTDLTREYPLYIGNTTTASEGLVWHEDYDYVGVEFPKIPSHGIGTAVNLQPDGTFVAMHAGDGTIRYESSNDYTKIPDIELEALVGEEWVDVATASWKETGSLVLTPHNGQTVNGVRVSVPEGTRSIRTTVHAKNAYLWYYIRPIINLHANEKMQQMVADGFAVTRTPMIEVTNTASMYVTDHNDEALVEFHKSAMDELHGYTTDIWVYPGKTGSQGRVNYDNDTVRVHWNVDIAERSVIPLQKTYEQALAEGRITPETEGVFYDLLPKGMYPDMSSIRLRSGDTVKHARMIPDYKGTGRILLVVEARLKPMPEAYKDGNLTYYQDVPTMSFDATIDFETLRDFGTNVHNAVAFQSRARTEIGTVENYSGHDDTPIGSGNIATSSAFENDAERDAFIGLADEVFGEDPDGHRFVYTGAYVNITTLGAARTSLSKDIMVNEDGIWSQGTYDDKRTVYEGGTYQYRLRMMSDTDTQSKDLVMYDSLENFYAADGNDEVDINAPRWRGTLVSVDVSQLEAKGIAPVVYYSTVDNLLLEDSTDPTKANALNTNLSDSSIWVKAIDYTGDMADVHAVAIDASKKPDGTDFILEPEDSVSAYIKMRAPWGEDARTYISQKGVWGDSAHAYNNAYLLCTNKDVTIPGAPDSENFVRKDYTKVGLEEYSLHIMKVWDDDDNRDGIRAETSIRFTLKANGQPLEELVLDKPTEVEKVTVGSGTMKVTGDSWGEVVFENIPYTDEDGKLVDYTVEEEQLDGYVVNVLNGADDMHKIFVNHHDPEIFLPSGGKRWEGDDESDRPSQIKLALVGDDGTVYSTVVVRPNMDGEWDYEFPESFVNANGEPISYHVEEIEGDDSYIASYDGLDTINTFHPFGELSITKEVVGATSEYEHKRFEFILNLSGEGAAGEYRYDTSDGRSGTITNGGSLEIENGQTATVHEVPEGAQYEWVEQVPDGYTQTRSSGLVGEVKANKINTASATNTYRADGFVNLSATKTLVGKTMSRYQFRFQLTDENGTLLRTGANAVDGSVTFGALTYTEADAGKTFKYRLSEVDRGRAGFTYDDTVYFAYVTVVDNGDGHLTCNVRYTDENDETVAKPSWENHYDAEGSVQLRAWKQLKGADLTDGQFSFELLGEDGTVLQTKTNDATGNVFFDEIHYDETDIGKTYHYAVREVNAGDSSVFYDDNVYGYEVNVIDNGDGTLTCGQGYVQSRLMPTLYSWDELEESERLEIFWNVNGTDLILVSLDRVHIPDVEDSSCPFGLTREDVTKESPYLYSDDNGWKPYEECGVRYESIFGPHFWHPVRYYLTESGKAKMSRYGINTDTVTFESTEAAISKFNNYGGCALDDYERFTPEELTGIGDLENVEFGDIVDTAPVFVNQMKPGSLSITKTVTPDTPAEHQHDTFRFRVKFIGEDVPDTIHYEVEEIDPTSASNTSN